MAMQMSQTNLATPKETPTGNPFGPEGGGGNLFRQGPVMEMSEEVPAKLILIAEKLGHSLLHDDAAGHMEYQQRVSIWESTYAGARPRL